MFRGNSGPPVGPACDECGRPFQVSHHCSTHHPSMMASSLNMMCCQIGGPMWLAPIHSHDFIDKVLHTAATMRFPLATEPRITGMLTLAKEVVAALHRMHSSAQEVSDAPFYHTLGSLCRSVHMVSPTMAALKCAGTMIVSRSNACQIGVHASRLPRVELALLCGRAQDRCAAEPSVGHCAQHCLTAPHAGHRSPSPGQAAGRCSRPVPGAQCCARHPVQGAHVRLHALRNHAPTPPAVDADACAGRMQI